MSEIYKRYVPVCLNAEDSQALEALAIMAGLDKQECLRSIVHEALRYQSTLLNMVIGGTQKKLREQNGPKEDRLEAAGARFKATGANS